MSSSFWMGTHTASAVTAPFVPGVQALAYAMRGNGRGEIACREKRSLDQPLPNGPHGSRCTLASCHSFILPVVHSAACLMFGELVSRGPWTSVRRSEEHTSELQSLRHLVCRLLLEK